MSSLGVAPLLHLYPEATYYVFPDLASAFLQQHVDSVLSKLFGYSGLIDRLQGSRLAGVFRAGGLTSQLVKWNEDLTAERK